MRSLLTSLALLAASASSWAVDNTVPEPGSLALVGIAGIAMAVAFLRKRK